MSGVLECDGVFQVPLSDGWTVSGQPGRAYDLSHATEDVAVNISVYAQGVVGPDIEAAVRKFVSSTGLYDSDLHIVVPSDGKTQRRAFTRFDSGDRTWLVAFLYVGDAAVLTTSNSPAGDHKAFTCGEAVVASLGPIQPKRRLFRRS